MTTSVSSSSATYATTKLHELYQTKQYTDCAFLVRNERFPCHRFHLALSSPVFESMFYGLLSKPTTTAKTLGEATTLPNDIRVDDVDPKYFQLMLDYLYTGDITFTSTEEACQVLYLAQKYILEELTRVTINYLQKHLSLNSLPLCFEYGQLYGDKELLQSCEKDLMTYAVGVLFFTDYHLKPENFKVILDAVSDETLSNCQKTLATIRWGLDECCLLSDGQVGLGNLQEVLTKAGLLEKIDLCGYKTEIGEDYNYYTKLLPNFEQLDSYALQLSNLPTEVTKKTTTGNCTVAKLRYNFRRVLKSASSLEIHRGARQFFKTVLISDKTILVFGLAISTKNLPYYHQARAPPAINQQSTSNVLVLLLDFTNGGRICYQMRSSVADTDNCYHDNVQLVRFHVPVVLTAGNKYVVSVSYESDEEGVCARVAPSVAGTGVRRESVLLKYMTEGVQCSQRGDCNVMFYDFEGSVLHGLSFYEL